MGIKFLGLILSATLLVFSFNNCGEMGDLDVKSEAVSQKLPQPPSTLSATAISSVQINLSWNSHSDNEMGFKIERSSSLNGTYSIIATLNPGVISYSDMGLSGNTAYFYRVYAFNNVGASTASNVANATTLAIPPPAAPSNLMATAASQTQINLTWLDNSNDEDGFKVERATNASGPFAVVAILAAGVRTHSDSGLNMYARYYYRVFSYKTTVSSAYTAVANVATLPPANTNAFVQSVTATASGARVVFTGPATAFKYGHNFSNGYIQVPGTGPFSSPLDVNITFPPGTTFICFQALGTNTDGQYWGPAVGDPQQCNSVP